MLLSVWALRVTIGNALMVLKYSDLEIDTEDQRVGMGIGGWRLKWTMRHIPSGCEISWETHGGDPNHIRARETAITLLELMVTEHYAWSL